MPCSCSTKSCDASSPSETPSGPVGVIKGLPPFRAGDTVVLKSGSPSLTVGGIEGGVIIVTWFTADGQANILKMPETCFLPTEDGTA